MLVTEINYGGMMGEKNSKYIYGRIRYSCVCFI
jgi:hypothetical protein